MGPKTSKDPKKSRPNAARKGCWTCRRYHRKCDERQPFCRRCVEEYGVECEGYGQRRVAFRMTQPKPNAVVRSTALLLRPPSRSLVPADAPTAGLPSEEQRLLGVFCAEFAPLAAISPLQDLYSLDIAPMTGTYHHVRAAVLALSAAHVGSLSGPGSLVDARRMHSAFAYYDGAVRLLRSVSPSTWHDRQAYLATIFLLAWFDILVFDPDKWSVHLRMACALINEAVDVLWTTASGRRIVHSVARLDCSNALCNRAPPMLGHHAYALLEQLPHHTVLDGDAASLLDRLVDSECMRLHGILGRAARLSFSWTMGGGQAPVRTAALDVLDRLQAWHESLPAALRWAVEEETEDAEDTPDTPGHIARWLADKPPLFVKLWLHYLAITVHMYHILEPVASGLWDVSVMLARRCVLLVRDLDARQQAAQSHGHGCYNGDMSILFVLAVVGVLIDDPADRSWIQNYLLHRGREILWCGYERAACLRAWWNSLGAGKRLILSQPDRDTCCWGAPTDGDIKVRIVYEDLETRQVQTDCHAFARCELETGGVHEYV